MSYEMIDSTPIYEDPWIKLHIDHLRSADGKLTKRSMIRTKNGAGAVAITANQEVCMIIQYRYPIGTYSLEIPKGAFSSFDSDETPIEVAQRELKEETGITGSVWGELGIIHTVTGYSNDTVHLFWTTDLTVGESNPDDTEELKMVKIPLAAIGIAVSEGIWIDDTRYVMTDATSIAAIFKALSRQEIWNRQHD